MPRSERHPPCADSRHLDTVDESTLGCWVIVEDTKKLPSPFYSACQGLDSVRASLQILQITVEKMKSLLGCWVIVEDMKSSLRCWVMVKDHEVIIRLLGHGERS